MRYASAPKSSWEASPYATDPKKLIIDAPSYDFRDEAHIFWDLVIVDGPTRSRRIQVAAPRPSPARPRSCGARPRATRIDGWTCSCTTRTGRTARARPGVFESARGLRELPVAARVARARTARPRSGSRGSRGRRRKRRTVRCGSPPSTRAASGSVTSRVDGVGSASIHRRRRSHRETTRAGGWRTVTRAPAARRPSSKQSNPDANPTRADGRAVIDAAGRNK